VKLRDLLAKHGVALKASNATIDIVLVVEPGAVSESSGPEQVGYSASEQWLEREAS